MEDLKSLIREVPDFPEPGIRFFDITTLLQDPQGLRDTVDRFVGLFRHLDIDKVIGIESRGFMFAPVVAYDLKAGFVPVRKPGKLPWRTLTQEYSLEYGTDTLEMHEDAISEGDRVLIIDDVIATGGTARATIDLVRAAGGEVTGLGFIIELTALGGRDRLDGVEVHSLLHL